MEHYRIVLHTLGFLVSVLLFLLPLPAAAQPGAGADPDSVSRREAIRRYESLLANPSPALSGKRDEMLFRLAFLYLEEAQARGTAASGAQSFYQKSADLFGRVIEGGTAVFREEALYYQGIAYEELGQRDRAAERFRQILRDFPSSTRKAEMWFRLAGDALRKNRLAEALDAYERVVSIGGSQYDASATYMVGWVASSTGDPAKARRALVSLLEHLEGSQGTDQDLYGESIGLLSEVVVAEKGPEPLLSSVRSKSAAFVEPVLRKAAALFEETGAHAQAATTLEKLLEVAPALADRDAVEVRLVREHLAAGHEDRAEEVRARVVNRHLQSGRIAKDAPPEVAALVFDSAVYLHRIGRDENRPAALEAAVTRYQAYVDSVPPSPEKTRASLLLAEALKESGQGLAAAEIYGDVASTRDAEEGEEAAFRRIVLFEELWEQKRATPFQLTSAYEDYLRSYPYTPRARDLRLRQARHLFDQKYFDDALRAAERGLYENPKPENRTELLLLAARSAYALGEYAQASRHARELLAVAGLPEGTRKDAREIDASALFRLAGSVKDVPHEAAGHYERLAALYPDDPSAPLSLYNAAVLLRDSGETARAAAKFREMASRYPRHERALEAIEAAADLHLQAGDGLAAAESLAEAAANRPGTAEADRWIYRAGTLARDAGATDRMIRYFGKFLEGKAAASVETATASAALARAHLERGQTKEAETLARAAISRASSANRTDGAERLDLARAEGHFVLGEIALRSYEGIRITEPVEKSLERKRESLETVVSHYREAARFGFADLSLASFYKIGYSQLAFSDALLDAPRPKNLSAEDRARYEALLRDEVAPYQREAEQAFRLALEQARGAGIENEWTARARAALGPLERNGAGEPRT